MTTEAIRVTQVATPATPVVTAAEISAAETAVTATTNRPLPPTSNRTMPTYDPQEMEALADKLEMRAASATVIYPAYGAALAGAATIWWAWNRGIVMIPIGTALLGGIAGFRIGQLHALSLRAQAQSLRCQMKIEENTRK